jgi:hypothetical protein
MTEEFNLSDKIFVEKFGWVIGIKDVKEFIKRLKELLNHELWEVSKGKLTKEELWSKINNLAGEKLI